MPLCVKILIYFLTDGMTNVKDTEMQTYRSAQPFWDIGIYQEEQQNWAERSWYWKLLFLASQLKPVFVIYGNNQVLSLWRGVKSHASFYF